MSLVGCAPLVVLITQLFRLPEVRRDLRALREREATRDEYIDLLASRAGPAEAALMREEFAALPAMAISLLVDAWAAADAAGKEFEVRSARPEEPIRFAKARKVRIALEFDSDSVVITLSHVAPYHAKWYAAPVAAAV